LGGRAEFEVDVRVLAATNKQPEEAVSGGHLREDLFYRLNVFHVHLPPLRDRKEDIPAMVQALVADMNHKHDCKVVEVSAEVLDCLQRHRWPGNVRELRNVLERAVILAGEGTIEVKSLPAFLQNRPATAMGVANDVAPAASGSGGAPPADDPDAVKFQIGTTVEEAEKGLILRTLEHTRNNKTRAAEILGISLKTLHNKLKEYGTKELVIGV
jgi:DNA-binding NtrC family response regulator